MSKTTLLMMIGVSGSGKSTYANSLPNCCVVSSDEIRKEYFSPMYRAEKNKMVFERYYEEIKDALLSGLYTTVVADSTNLQIASVKDVFSIACDINCLFEIVIMDTPFNDCVQRNSLRTQWRVPDERLKEQEEEKKIITKELLSNFYLSSILSFVSLDNATNSYVLNKPEYRIQDVENDKNNFIQSSVKPRYV